MHPFVALYQHDTVESGSILFCCEWVALTCFDLLSSGFISSRETYQQKRYRIVPTTKKKRNMLIFCIDTVMKCEDHVAPVGTNLVERRDIIMDS